MPKAKKINTDLRWHVGGTCGGDMPCWFIRGYDYEIFPPDLSDPKPAFVVIDSNYGIYPFQTLDEAHDFVIRSIEVK